MQSPCILQHISLVGPGVNPRGKPVIRALQKRHFITQMQFQKSSTSVKRSIYVFNIKLSPLFDSPNNIVFGSSFNGLQNRVLNSKGLP